MYFSNIFNTEAENVIKSRKYDGIESLNNLTDGIWIKETHDSILRLFPLFNCNSITSSNDNDIIIEDNKVVICENLDDTILNLNSSGNIRYNGINLFLYSSNNDGIVNQEDSVNLTVLCYDDTNKLIPNIEVTVKFRLKNNNYILTRLTTDENGEAEYSFKFDFEDTIIISASTEANDIIYSSNELQMSIN